MDIVRAFECAGIANGFKFNIQGTLDDPLFQANQIGELLGLSNVRESIKDFDEDEKGVQSSTDSAGRPQNMLFLTELALAGPLPPALCVPQAICTPIPEVGRQGGQGDPQDWEI